MKQEKVEEQRRKREIDADEEMDRGRQKKAKHNQSGSGAPSNPGYNAFQENQNQMNGGSRYNHYNSASRFYNQNFHRNNNFQHKQYTNFRGRQRGGYRHDGYNRWADVNVVPMKWWLLVK